MNAETESHLEISELVAEFVPLNRRRIHGNPALSEAEHERWAHLRELLEYGFGVERTTVGPSRRRYLRVPTDAKLMYSTGADHTACAGDISEGGVFIETDEMLAVGTSLRLELDAPERPIRVDARVIWARELPNISGPKGLGLAFENLEAEDAEALTQFVERALVRAVGHHASPQGATAGAVSAPEPHVESAAAGGNAPGAGSDTDILDFFEDLVADEK